MAVQLTHHFTVPSDIDETWVHFQDVAGLAGCFPGATVTSVDGDDFTGACKVKLGPIALVYNGSGTFTGRDESAHRLDVEAKGKDKRGNGTAAARATLTMSANASGGTDVDVVTDLAITGKPAQFGRGLMQDVSDKLLGQFVACLEQQLTPDVPATEAAVQTDAGSAASDAASEGSGAEATSTSAAPGPAVVPGSPTQRTSSPQSDDALDLGATVLPVLLKTYWKPAAAGVGVLAFLIWLIRR